MTRPRPRRLSGSRFGRLPGRVVRRLDAELAPRVEQAHWSLLEQVSGASRRTVVPTAVALTFDDGPHPGTTGAILDTLAAAGAVATFFCVGRNAVAHPELVRRIRAEGHAVGSHSWSHPDPEVTPLRVLRDDYRRGHQAIEEALGAPVRLFRPPRGWLDLARAVQLRRLGLAPVLWSVDPEDWQPDAEVGQVAAVVGGAGPGDVVLLHDWVEQPRGPGALTREATLAALPIALDRLAGRGLRFVALA